MAQTNKTQYAILGILDIHPCSGYDIKKFCDEGIAHFWNENFGHIYPMLRKMENNKLITRKTAASDKKPNKNIYHITEKGRNALENWLLQPEECAPSRNELLLKLYFGKNISKDKIIEKLEQSKSAIALKLNEFKKFKSKYEGNKKIMANESYHYWFATLSYGINFCHFKINWLEETIKNIQSNKENL